MVKVGYALSSEEHGPAELVRQARLAADAGIRTVWISDHYHPWLDDRGRHFTVENARVYSAPTHLVPVLVSGFGPKATNLAARIGDGYVSTRPDKALVERYRTHGGRGPASAGIKVCWGPDAGECARTAHRLWRTSGVPGELSQELRTPAHFEQAASLVSVEAIAEKMPCGPAAEPIVEAVRAYVDAGFDRVYLTQVGTNQAEFFRFFDGELAGALADIGVSTGSDGGTADRPPVPAGAYS